MLCYWIICPVPRSLYWKHDPGTANFHGVLPRNKPATSPVSLATYDMKKHCICLVTGVCSFPSTTIAVHTTPSVSVKTFIHSSHAPTAYCNVTSVPSIFSMAPFLCEFSWADFTCLFVFFLLGTLQALLYSRTAWLWQKSYLRLLWSILRLQFLNKIILIFVNIMDFINFLLKKILVFLTVDFFEL